MGERASASSTVERIKPIETQPAPAWGKERDESDSTVRLRKMFSLQPKMSDQCWPPPQASHHLQWKSTLQVEALRVLHELVPADSLTLTSHSQTPRSPHGLCLSPKQDCLAHVLPGTLLFGSGFPTPRCLSPSFLYLCLLPMPAPQASLLELAPSLVLTRPIPRVTAPQVGPQVSLYLHVHPTGCCRHLKSREFTGERKAQALEWFYLNSNLKPNTEQLKNLGQVA